MSTIVFIEKLYFNSNCRFRLCSHHTGELFLSPRKVILYSVNSNDPGRHKSLNIYFRLSGFQASLLLMYFRHGPRAKHVFTLQQTIAANYPICDAPSRSARRSFVPPQKSRRSDGSYVWTEAAIGYGFRTGAKVIQYSETALVEIRNDDDVRRSEVGGRKHTTASFRFIFKTWVTKVTFLLPSPSSKLKFTMCLLQVI